MAKKRAPSAKPVITCSPAWAWFFAGILVGVVISFAFYLHEIAPNRLTAENVVSTSPNTVLATAETQPKNEVKPESVTEKHDNQFEFYDVLPHGGAKKTTPIIVEEPSETDDDIGAIDLSPVQVPGTYLLQVGSFRDSRGAEALQTYLATLNVRTYVQQATVKEASGTTVLWHRVMAGPFTDLNILNQTRNTLAIQNIYTIVINVASR